MAPKLYKITWASLLLCALNLLGIQKISPHFYRQIVQGIIFPSHTNSQAYTSFFLSLRNWGGGEGVVTKCLEKERASLPLLPEFGQELK